MYVFVRIRYSQALRLVPCLYWWKAANALAKVSWTRSSASAGLRVVRRAALYSWSRKGMASFSNRAALSAGVSVLISSVGSSSPDPPPIDRSTIGSSDADPSASCLPAMGVFGALWKALWSAVIAFQPNADGGL